MEEHRRCWNTSKRKKKKKRKVRQLKRKFIVISMWREKLPDKLNTYLGEY